MLSKEISHICAQIAVFTLAVLLFLNFSGKTQGSCPQVGAQATGHFSRAMWVWNTNELLESPSKFEELIQFSSSEGINHLFLQIVTETVDGQKSIQRPDRMRDFISSAQLMGIHIHALDGDPHYALEVHHPAVLAQVEAVLDFNDGGNANQRFHAVRLDVEPYLLPAWAEGGESRDSIMRAFLDMNQKVANLIGERMPDLRYGADIPFWFDSRTTTGDPEFEIEYNGLKDDLATHVIRLVDNIGIMAYRNVSSGPDGVLEISYGEMEAADLLGTTVFIGLETNEPDGDGIPEKVTFGHLTRADLDRVISEVEEGAAQFESFRGVAIHDYKAFRKLTDQPTPGGSPLFFDNFDDYTDDASLRTNWQGFGFALSGEIYFTPDQGCDGSGAAIYVGNWNNAAFFGAFRPLHGQDLSGAKSLSVAASATTNPFANEPAVASSFFRFGIEGSNGDIWESTENQALDNTALKTFTFEISEEAMHKQVNGTGDGTLEQALASVADVRLIFVNSGGTGIQNFTIDNFAVLPEPEATGLTFAAWLDRNNVPVESRAIDASPAGDGLDNLIKFALNIDPLAPSREQAPVHVIVEDGGAKYSGLEFNRATNVSGVELRLHASTDLITWNEVDSELSVLETLSETAERVLLRTLAPLEVLDHRSFLRLVAVLDD